MHPRFEDERRLLQDRLKHKREEMEARLRARMRRNQLTSVLDSTDDAFKQTTAADEDDVVRVSAEEDKEVRGCSSSRFSVPFPS